MCECFFFFFSGSEMVIVQPSRDSFATLDQGNNATLRGPTKPALWEQDSSALGEIRRSGSDMYLSQTLLHGDESSPVLTPMSAMAATTPQTLHNSGPAIHIENTPMMGRKPVPTRLTDSDRKNSAPETTPGESSVAYLYFALTHERFSANTC